MTPNITGIEESGEGTRATVASRLVVWLVVISLAALLMPLYLVSKTIEERVLPLETELADLQATLSSTPPPAPEEALKATLIYVGKSASAIEAFKPTLEASHVDWPGVMAVLSEYDQTQLALAGIAEADRRITLTGQAVDENAVVAYADRLRQSDYFSRVIVQSIMMEATPTPAPTPSPDATGMGTEFSILVELKTS